MKAIQFIAFFLALQFLNIPLLSSQDKVEKSNSFSLALCQMRVVGGECDLNLRHAAEMIAEAARAEP